MSIARYINTARHLRPGQLASWLGYRLTGMRAPRRPFVGGVRRIRAPAQFVTPPRDACDPGEISFLNRVAPFALDRIDWRAASQPKLWRYNLHYLDYLHGPGFSPEQRAAILDSWIAANPPGCGDGWEPYPLSLRVVNWVKYFWRGVPVPASWNASLAEQLGWLARNLEYHLLANHLLKNAKALVFGGAYFAGADADAVLRDGLRLMVAEGDEQVLPDGGHFERSLMYHAIVLEDYLDVVNLLRHNPELAAPADCAALQSVATRAWVFFRDMLAGDGAIPLFNDAAFGIAPDPARLLDYGREVLGPAVPPADPEPKRICMPDSGYFGYRSAGDSLLIDCGPGGPDYQPGHTHADLLSYELCLDGHRIVVDSGVFSYENDALRQELRGTAAHNTVRVDGADQSEVWGAFRVARRARPLTAELSSIANGCLVFRGSHDGYRRLPGRVVHERRITAEVAGKWDIEDLLTGGGEHMLESYVNLHPSCSLAPEAERSFLVSVAARPVVRIAVAGDAAVQIGSGWYCPEFGKKLENKKLVMRSSGRLPARLGYTIMRA